MAEVASAPPSTIYRRADIRFHVGIAEAARSPRLISEMTEVQGRMSELITLIAHPPEVLLHSNEQHRRLVGLLRATGTSARAVRVMREHIEGTEHILAGFRSATVLQRGGALDERAPLAVRRRRATPRRAAARIVSPTGIRSSISSVERHTPAPTAASAAAPAAVASSAPR